MGDIPRDAEGYPADPLARDLERRLEQLLAAIPHVQAPRTLRAEVMAQVRTMRPGLAMRLRRAWARMGVWRVPVQLAPIAALVALVVLNERALDMRPGAPGAAPGPDGALVASLPQPSPGLMLAQTSSPEALPDIERAGGTESIQIAAAPTEERVGEAELAQAPVEVAAATEPPASPAIARRDISQEQDLIDLAAAVVERLRPQRMDVGDAPTDGVRAAVPQSEEEVEIAAAPPVTPAPRMSLSAPRPSSPATTPFADNIEDLRQAQTALSMRPELPRSDAEPQDLMPLAPEPAPAELAQTVDETAEPERGPIAAQITPPTQAPPLQPPPPQERARQLTYHTADPEALLDSVRALVEGREGRVVSSQAVTSDRNVLRVAVRIAEYQIEPLQRELTVLTNPALANAAQGLGAEVPAQIPPAQRQFVDVEILLYRGTGD